MLLRGLILTDIYTGKRFASVAIRAKRGIRMEYISKTLWNGKVGVPDYIIQDCINRGEPLKIVIANEGIMTMRSWELGDRIVGQSDRKFIDKFRRNFSYYLKYFKWQPEERIVRLL